MGCGKQRTHYWRTIYILTNARFEKLFRLLQHFFLMLDLRIKEIQRLIDRATSFWRYKTCNPNISFIDK
jgi:hypothetical protein